VTIGTALVVIVAIIAGTVSRLVRYSMRSDRRTLSVPPPDDGTRTLVHREVEDLRERVRVLERIATDANTTAALETRKIADEIEALRNR
jgi:hypothetical protein